MAAVSKAPVKAGNKPGEPPFKLELVPRESLTIKWEKGVGSTFSDLKLTNQLDDPQCFKVKCTDNTIFRVRPPVGFLSVKTTISIRVIQHSVVQPAANKHFIAIQHMACTAADTRKPFRSVWRVDSKPDGVIRIPVQFGDAPAAPLATSGAAAAAAADLNSAPASGPIATATPKKPAT